MFSFLRRAKTQIKFKQFNLLSSVVFKRLLYIAILIYCAPIVMLISGFSLFQSPCFHSRFKRRFQALQETVFFSFPIQMVFLTAFISSVYHKLKRADLSTL